MLCFLLFRNQYGHSQVFLFILTFDLVFHAAQAKQKTEEASKSEAKFLKMKAWSKTRIRQLEEELRRSQVGNTANRRSHFLPSPLISCLYISMG